VQKRKKKGGNRGRDRNDRLGIPKKDEKKDWATIEVRRMEKGKKKEENRIKSGRAAQKGENQNGTTGGAGEGGLRLKDLGAGKVKKKVESFKSSGKISKKEQKLEQLNN